MLYLMEESGDKNNSTDGVERANREAAFADGIALSRRHPRLLPPDGEEVAARDAEDLVHEVDNFLSLREVYDEEERKQLLEKLDSAIAINNHPKAKEIRKGLIEKFGKETK